MPPPPGFEDDLKLIGSKFDPVDHMEKEHNPELANLKSNSNSNQNTGNSPNLQSSFGQLQSLFNPLAALQLGNANPTPGEKIFIL